MTIVLKRDPESITGMASRILLHLESSGIRSKQKLTRDEVDCLTVEELYNACPCADLIKCPPSDRSWDTMRAFQFKLDAALDKKTMNEWARNICLLVQDRKTRKPDYMGRAT